MRRVFWVALGATAGVLVVRRLSQMANKWTPEGIASQAGGVGDRIAQFWAEVQQGAAEREAELRGALGLTGEPEDALGFEERFGGAR